MMQNQLRIYTFFFSLFLIFTSQAQVQLDFSKKRGFNSNPFNLTITATNPSAVIRFTVNGDEPSTTNGTIYSGNINITTTAVIRAIGYVAGADTSKIYTHTYLFLDDVIQQPANIAGWPNNNYSLGGSGSAQHDYEMDPSIVNSPLYSADIIKGLEDIPSLSIVMPKADFWNMYDGNSEQKTSVELLYAADSNMNEQVDGGIEPHSHDRLKRSMRLSFKALYGPSNWKTDIFRNAVLGSENAVDKLDRIVLRGGNNRAWSRNWNEDRTAFTRDEWFRQSQLAASGVGSHGTFVHLYVNGLYWGMYNPVERLDESFTAAYLCGEKEDMFAVSHGGDQGGDDTRYDYLMNTILSNNLSQANNYNEFKDYLDVSKFCDYVLLSWMTGVQDWPGNNWWGGNNNNPAGPFMYFGWDNEWSWDVTNNANNGAWVHPAFESTDNGGQNSALVFNKAKNNLDFMMKFADRAYKLCFNNGAMTDSNSRVRWSILNNYIEDAVISESARWGDGLNDGTTRTRDIHWKNEVDRIDSLMNGNVQQLMTALYAENYYPTIDPPLFENNNVAIDVQEISVPANYAIDLLNPNTNGEIYYSLNGVDPRADGGGLSPSAINYLGGNVAINQSVLLLARVKNGNDWSALHCLKLFVQNDFSMVKLTEIMYNPTDFGLVSGSELEFLEVKNTSTTLSVDLSGVSISNGVKYDFPMGTIVAPQDFVVVASNPSELLAKCPGVDILGKYKGQLRNSGEKIEFVNFIGDTIIEVEYDDDVPWAEEADGDGYSLVSSLANPIGDQNSAPFWKLSNDSICGSPGEDDVYLTTNGLSDMDQALEVLVYPNPVSANSILTIRAERKIEGVELFTIYGQAVQVRILDFGNERLVFRSPEVSGTYMLRLRFEDGRLENRVVVVR